MISNRVMRARTRLQGILAPSRVGRSTTAFTDTDNNGSSRWMQSPLQRRPLSSTVPMAIDSQLPPQQLTSKPKQRHDRRGFFSSPATTDVAQESDVVEGDSGEDTTARSSASTTALDPNELELKRRKVKDVSEISLHFLAFLFRIRCVLLLSSLKSINKEGIYFNSIRNAPLFIF